MKIQWIEDKMKHNISKTVQWILWQQSPKREVVKKVTTTARDKGSALNLKRGEMREWAKSRAQWGFLKHGLTTNYTWFNYVLSKVTKLQKLLTWATDFEIWNWKYHYEACNGIFDTLPSHVLIKQRPKMTKTTVKSSIWLKQLSSLKTRWFCGQMRVFGGCLSCTKLQQVEILSSQIR